MKPRRAKPPKVKYGFVLLIAFLIISGAFFTLYRFTPWSTAIEEVQAVLQEMLPNIRPAVDQDVSYTEDQGKAIKEETIEVKSIMSAPQFRQKPFLMDGLTFVPVRELAEFLDLSLKWDSDLNEIIMHCHQRDMYFEISADQPGFGVFLRQEEEEKRRIELKKAVAEAAEFTDDVSGSSKHEATAEKDSEDVVFWPYYIEDGVVFLPIRPLADYLNWNINWDSDAGLISLSAENGNGEPQIILFNVEFPYSRYLWPPPNRVAYLTFDDGPSKAITPLILDILRENGIKATFFVVGRQVNIYPEMLELVYEEGHAIGNHTYSHQTKALYSGFNSFMNEVDQCEEIIYKTIGQKPKIFRMPYSTSISQWSTYRNGLQEKGYSHISWNVNSGDASGQNVPTEHIIAEVKRQVAGKSEVIILFHDLNWENTAKALPEIILYLKGQGFFFRKFDWQS